MPATKQPARFNLRLHMAIAQSGRAQYVIAHEAGITESRMSSIKRGNHFATDEIKQSIADALGMTVAELFDTPTETK